MIFLMTSYYFEKVKLSIKVPEIIFLSSLKVWDSNALTEKELETFFSRLLQGKTKSNTGTRRMNRTTTFRFPNWSTDLVLSMLARESLKNEDLSIPYDRSQTRQAALVKERYGISNMELLKASFAREWLLMKRNSFYTYSRPSRSLLCQ